MNKIIAISGLKNSGKNLISTIFEFLFNTPKIFHSYFWYKHRNLILNLFGYNNYKIVAFADSIKDMLSDLLNIPRERFEDRDFKECWFIDLTTLTLLPIHNIAFEEMLSDAKFSKLAKEWNPELSKQYKLTIRQVMQLFGTEIMRNYIDDKIWINSTLKKAWNQNIIISDLRFITEFEEIKKQNGFIIYIDRGLTPGLHKSESEMSELLEHNKFDLIINNKNISIKQLFNKVKDIYDKNCIL